MTAWKMDNMNTIISSANKSYTFTAALPERSSLVGFVCNLSPAPSRSIYASMGFPWRIAQTRKLVRERAEFIAAPIASQPSPKLVHVVCPLAYAANGATMKGILADYGLTIVRPIGTLFDSTIQTILQFTLFARISPSWNPLGTHHQFLVHGPHFMLNGCASPAIKFDITVLGNEVKLSLCPLKMKIAHLSTADLEIKSSKIMDFVNHEVEVLTEEDVDLEWIFTLPSLKQARIVKVSHTIPDASPLRTYKDFFLMWLEVYGFCLPPPSDDPDGNSPAGPYITIKYSNQRNTANSPEYTFPALCVRPYQPIFYKNDNQMAILSNFVDTVNERCPMLCDFPFKLSNNQRMKQSKQPGQGNAEYPNLTAAQKSMPASSSKPRSLIQDEQSEMKQIVASLRLQQQQLNANQPTNLQVARNSEPKEADSSLPKNAGSENMPSLVPMSQLINSGRGSPYLMSNVNLTPTTQVHQQSNSSSSCVQTSARNASTGGHPMANSNLGLVPGMSPTANYFASTTLLAGVPANKFGGNSGHNSSTLLKRHSIGQSVSVAAPKKHILDPEMVDMVNFVEKGKVGTLNVPFLRTWLASKHVPIGSRCKKDDLVKLVISYVQETTPNFTQ